MEYYNLKVNIIARFWKCAVLPFNVALLILGLASCKKMVSVNPPVTQPDASVVYSNNTTAVAVLTGLYTEMATGGSLDGANGISLIAGLSADELQAYAASGSLQLQAYSNSLTSLNSPFWSQFYNYIYITNAALAGLKESAKVSDSVKRQLTGEALFMRAFFHFYLVNLFGDVPLVTTSNYSINATLSRTPKAQVYHQIVLDLISAQGLLSPNFVGLDMISTTSERVRPTKWAATALLARVYLYMNDWADAEIQAKSVIDNSSLFTLDSLNSIFLANSSEAVWQLQPGTLGYNTMDGNAFILNSAPNTYQPVSISTFLFNSFEAGDNRVSNWIGSIIVGSDTFYYPDKYKIGPYNSAQPLTEYLTVLRLAEQYLIRAEAEANGAGNGISAAISDLNIIRNRAGLADYAGTMDKTSILNAIYHERRVELFSEWGHRWFDLKRTNAVDSVMSIVTPQKGGTWNTDWQLYPIPLISAIKLDPNLTQNPGYQ